MMTTLNGGRRVVGRATTEALAGAILGVVDVESPSYLLLFLFLFLFLALATVVH
jgi:hypothetical protein